MANPINPYKIEDGGYITIKNIKVIEKAGTKDAYVREEIKRGTDGKIETPDAGRITKFGPVTKDNTGTETEPVYVECIHIPADMAAVKLPLYRAGAGTTVTIPAELEATATGIIITPTLSEEVIYYKAACAELGLTFAYEKD